LSAAGLDVISEIVERDPKHALVERAEAWNANIIFLGASGQG
jgi:nucleotide-binding universal stress UspA family protein